MKNNFYGWWKLRWVSVTEIILIFFVIIILLLEMRLFFYTNSKTVEIIDTSNVEALGSVNLLIENGALFNNPAGFAGDDDGNIFFAWRDYSLCAKISSEHPQSIMSWDGDQSGQHPFVSPAFVMVSAKESGGNTWVLDAGNGWIYKIDNEENVDAKINAAKWGVYNPQGLAVDSNGNIYIADTGGGRLLKSDPYGNLLNEWGSFGKRKNQLNDPKGIVVIRNSLFVVDSNNNRIVHYDLNGKWIDSWKIDEGSYDVAIDGKDQLYVVSRKNNLIQVFSLNGKLINNISPENLSPTIHNIVGISISPNGKFFIMSEKEISIFRFTGNK